MHKCIIVGNKHGMLKMKKMISAFLYHNVRWATATFTARATVRHIVTEQYPTLI